MPNGLPTPWNEDLNEYLFSVLDTVCDYEDPATAPSLTPFLRTGNRVLSTLAKFGDRAVESVGLFAETAAMDDQNLSAALLLLRRMMEQQGSSAISAVSESTIRRVTHLRLSSGQSPVVAVQAIQLAAVSRDAGLIERLKELATDREQPARLVNRGNADEMVDHVRAVAAQALREPSQ